MKQINIHATKIKVMSGSFEVILPEGLIDGAEVKITVDGKELSNVSRILIDIDTTKDKSDIQLWLNSGIPTNKEIDKQCNSHEFVEITKIEDLSKNEKVFLCRKCNWKFIDKAIL